MEPAGWKVGGAAFKSTMILTLPYIIQYNVTPAAQISTALPKYELFSAIATVIYSNHDNSSKQ